MSGTSADGIDVALVRIALATPAARASRILRRCPFRRDVRAAVLRVAEGAPASPGDLSQLNFRLGQVFAQAAAGRLPQISRQSARIALIGSHGQTVYHQGAPSRFLGARVASTLQIGEPAVIAARTGITTVGDFRPADMAVGGQGAPLVPCVDYLLYRDARRGRAALNIGGIANVTVIPRAARARRRLRLRYRPGQHGRGRPGAPLHPRTARLRSRRAHGRSAAACFPPCSTICSPTPISAARRRKPAGREQYGEPYLGKLLAWGRRHRAQPGRLGAHRHASHRAFDRRRLSSLGSAASARQTTDRLRRRRAQSADHGRNSPQRCRRSR